MAEYLYLKAFDLCVWFERRMGWLESPDAYLSDLALLLWESSLPVEEYE